MTYEPLGHPRTAIDWRYCLVEGVVRSLLLVVVCLACYASYRYVAVYHLRDVEMTSCSVVDAAVVMQPCVVASTIQVCYAARWTVAYRGTDEVLRVVKIQEHFTASPGVAHDLLAHHANGSHSACYGSTQSTSVQWNDPHPGAWMITAVCGWSLAVVLAVALMAMHWRAIRQAAASCERLVPFNQPGGVEEEEHELWLAQQDL